MKIVAHTRFRNGSFSLGNKIIQESSGNIDHDLLNAWRNVGVDESRFLRADPPSQLTMLAAAPLFSEKGPLPGTQKDLIGMVFMSRNGSLETDVKFNTALREQLASPALFVRTLPNIALGELSIQFGLHGSGLCLLADHPDVVQLAQAAEMMFQYHGMKYVICIWTDIFAGRASATCVVLGESGTEAAANTIEQLRSLFDER